MRIGLYGGSFDPVHIGHLLVAQAALEEFEMDRLVFIPAAQSPFKPGSSPAPGPFRLRWLRLALQGQTRCSVDDWELQRGGVSYSIDTVRHFRTLHPHARILFLIGEDHLPQLPRWREAEELAKQVEFVLVPRPGNAHTTIPDGFTVHRLRGFPLAVSSSQIRERIRSGLPIEPLVPSTVASDILQNRLYLDAAPGQSPQSK